MELIPQFDLVLVQILTFAVGFWAIWNLYIKALRSHLKARKEGIVRDLASAEQARAEAEALRVQLAKERVAMAEELRQAKEQAKADVARLREELMAKAKAEQESLLKNGRAQIKAETLEAIAQVRDHAAKLVVEATSKLIEKKLDSKADQALAQRVLDSVKVKAPR